VTVRVIIDRRRCIGAGTCLYVAPSAFRWRDGDFLKPELLDPSTVEDDVLREAAAACPTQAIIIEEAQDTFASPDLPI
jgi:ferredoxin